MSDEKDILILAIESSCDETAAAVVKNGRTVLSNVISSQIELHKLYGGVVPEIASRKHIEKINQVIGEALSDAGVTLDDLDAVGVTYGPGLVGALLVGVAEAKAISWAKKLPLVGVHHIEGHVSANYIENPDLEPPFLCLIVSGGHTHLVIVKDYGEFEILGKTRDDAAGEAFDKVARAIGLGYPGGPKIDKLSREGNPDAIPFPKAKLEDGPYDFSFSGVKSAVLNHINRCRMQGEPICERISRLPSRNQWWRHWWKRQWRRQKLMEWTGLPSQGAWRQTARCGRPWSGPVRRSISVFTTRHPFSVRTMPR